MLTLHEDAFYEYFKPYRHRDALHDIWGGHGLETFGADLDLVQSLNPSYLWTVVDGARAQWITSGVWYVNRVCYLLTEKPHNSINMEFRVLEQPSTLTLLGLRKQLIKIHKLVSMSVLS
jgi:hypothetical protein